MLQFLIENFGTLIVGLIVLGVITFVAVYIIKTKKKGICSGCSGCANVKACQKFQKNIKKK